MAPIRCETNAGRAEVALMVWFCSAPNIEVEPRWLQKGARGMGACTGQNILSNMVKLTTEPRWST